MKTLKIVTTDRAEFQPFDNSVCLHIEDNGVITVRKEIGSHVVLAAILPQHVVSVTLMDVPDKGAKSE